MEITNNKVVSFGFVMKDEAGNILDGSFNEEIVYLHGYHHILPILEEGLIGKKTGEIVIITIPPEKGYGLREERLVQSVPRAQFADSDKLKVGMKIFSPENEDFVMTVAAVQEEVVLLDANHPLAGKVLQFEITITNIREATPTEIAKQMVLSNS
jgi:FKBP-type peptidyl-prolyl cis-trans isomerase SlyD